MDIRVEKDEEETSVQKALKFGIWGSGEHQSHLTPTVMQEEGAHNFVIEDSK